MKHGLILLIVLLLAASTLAQDAPRSKALLDLSFEPPVINIEPGPEYDAQNNR